MEKTDQAPAAHALRSSSGEAPPSAEAGARGDESAGEDVVGCGWGRFRPVFLAPFAHVWTFIVFYLIFSFTHGVQGSYTISVLTTLERRFKLPSFLAGALVTISTVGYMASAVFISFFFAKKNQPRLFAVCMLLTSLCAILYVIPHIVYGTGNDAIDAEHAQRQALINGSAPPEGGSGAVQLCALDGIEVGGGGGGGGGGEAAGEESHCSAAMRQAADEGVAFVMPALALFASSEIVQGIAGAPVWTVGLAFIDDHTNPELSAKLIGLIFTVRFVSPMVSFAMGGYLLSIYANLKETDLTAEHPRWIGAWWLGFLICSIINFVICIPTSMIPRNLRPIRSQGKTDAEEEEEKEEEEDDEEEEVNETKEKEEKEEKGEGDREGKQDKEDKEQKKKEKEGKETKDQDMIKKEGKEDENGEKKEKEEKEKKDQDMIKKEEKEGKEDENGEKKEKEGKIERIVDEDIMKTLFVPSTTTGMPQESPSSRRRPPPSKKSSSTADWKELPKATMRLVTNPIYMLASIAICIDCLILGFMAFLPKYFEVHFQKTASVANLLGGMIPAIFGGCASYVGGLVSGRIKGIDGGVAGLCRMNSSLSLICLLFLVPAMFLSCPDIPYSGHLVNNRLNLTTDCNVNCGCSSDVFDPVCGSDGFLYFSPCHAGCTQPVNSTADHHPNDLPGSLRLVRSAECRCVAEAESRDEDQRERIVFAGFCGDSCASLIPYVLILVAIFFSINMYNVPCTTIILRCIREEDKSFALGLQTFGICLTIFPAPLLYGNVFDSSCVLKESRSCTDSEGSCLLYDRHALRLAFHGLTIGLHSIATILYYVTYFLARRKLSLLTAQHETQLTEMKAFSANRLTNGENPNETEIMYM